MSHAQLPFLFQKMPSKAGEAQVKRKIVYSSWSSLVQNIPQQKGDSHKTDKNQHGLWNQTSVSIWQFLPVQAMQLNNT